MWFSPFHRLKPLAQKVACPGIIDCFNAHQLIFTEPPPWAAWPHPPTQIAVSVVRPYEAELWPKTLKTCGGRQHQTPESSVSLVASRAGRSWWALFPPSWRAKLRTFPSGACQEVQNAVILVTATLTRHKASWTRAVSWKDHTVSPQNCLTKQMFPRQALLKKEWHVRFLSLFDLTAKYHLCVPFPKAFS